MLFEEPWRETRRTAQQCTRCLARCNNALGLSSFPAFARCCHSLATIYDPRCAHEHPETGTPPLVRMRKHRRADSARLRLESAYRCRSCNHRRRQARRQCRRSSQREHRITMCAVAPSATQTQDRLHALAGAFCASRRRLGGRGRLQGGDRGRALQHEQAVPPGSRSSSQAKHTRGKTRQGRIMRVKKLTISAVVSARGTTASAVWRLRDVMMRDAGPPLADITNRSGPSASSCILQ